MYFECKNFSRIVARKFRPIPVVIKSNITRGQKPIKMWNFTQYDATQIANFYTGTVKFWVAIEIEARKLGRI
jgi:hypothetical protein